jgi:hypothetical protein
VSAIYNFFLAAFSFTFPSRLFILISLFSLIVDIEMYHRAGFIEEFSTDFISNPAFL